MTKAKAREHTAKVHRPTRRAPGVETKKAVRKRRSSLRSQRPKQAELNFRSWGGARRGAGRKPKGARALVPHDTRPAHKARFPLLITSRLRPGLPSLRRTGEAECIRTVLASSNLAVSIPAVSPRATTTLAAGVERAHGHRSVQQQERGRGIALFQVVHHSIQSNHLHLIVEAADRAALSGGMRGLLIRIARALNRLWGRAGSVFADRFHEHELRSPRQVRNALVYVLQNLRKHGIHLDGPDPLSSGPKFDGWSAGSVLANRWSDRRASMRGGGGAWCPPIAPLRAARGATPTPGTWLLHVGWRLHGPIDPSECPKAH